MGSTQFNDSDVSLTLMTAAAIYLNTDEIDWGRRVMLLQLVQE
jgi:hypothetical protein